MGRFEFLGKLLALPCAVAFLSSAVASAPPPSRPAAVRLGALPLYFEANRGQADERVHFFARGREHAIYLGADGATIALKQNETTGGTPNVSNGSNGSNQSGAILSPLPFRGEGDRTVLHATVRFLRMHLLGANPRPTPAAVEQLPGRINYLLGNDPAQWLQAVPTFARVRYHEVYPGIDLVYYGNEQELEYDFLLAPGADPEAIALHFDGADRLELDAQGDLILHCGPDQLRQHKPVAYQTIAGSRREVTARYQIKDQRTVVFTLGRYDRAHSLVIDPILSYSTYLGGSKGDIGWAIAVDANGSAYVAGDTLSIFKKLPTSGLQSTNGGGTKYGGDAFIARLDFDGTNLSLGYLTYLGGSGLDGAVGIAVDAAKAAYVTGYTTSSNFPAFPAPGAPGLVQTNIGGTNVTAFKSHRSDAFVTKLDTNGFGVYSTYLGGEFSETGADIAVDATGAAYVTGYTDSALIFRATNWVQTIRCTNVVTCTNLVCETNYSLACGQTNNATNTTLVRLILPIIATTNTATRPTVTTTNLTTTNTVTTNIQTIVTTTVVDFERLTLGFPVVGAVQTNNGGSAEIETADLFVSQLNADGSALVYSTYLGGSGEDFGAGIAVDPAGHAVVSGWSESTDFPLTNAIQSAFGGGRDAVLARLNPGGSALIYATYLGGQRRDAAYRVAVDATGNAYLVGATGSTDFPSTPGAFNRGGVFSSDAGGANWTNTSAGLQHTVIRALLADPINLGTLYAATPRGVFKSIDNGQSWRPGNDGLAGILVNTFALDPIASVPLFAGTTAGLFLSGNGGTTWTNHPLLGNLDVRTIIFEPGNPSTIYAGTVAGVYVNTNLATNWLALNTGLNRSVRALAIDPATPSTLYAATDRGVYKSTNSGVNWKASNTGLKTKTARALTLDPASPQTLYLGTTRGFYKSVDAATNWTLLTNGLGRPAITALLLHTNATSTLYAGTTNGLYKSLDAGATWFLSQSNLNTRDVSALAFPAAGSATLLAGTRGTNFAGGTNDAFLVKLAPDGQSFAYAFTFGGNRNDEAWDVSVDANGCAFVTGQTASRNFPVAGPPGSFTSTNAWQTNLAGKIDAFVAQFDPTGASNVFSIYFGGKRNDFGHGLALDPTGNAYLVGRTESSRLPTTNALQSLSSMPLTFGGGRRDAFVAKFLTGTPPLSVQPVVLPAENALPPHLELGVRVSWPASAPEFTLECREQSAGQWRPVPQTPTMNEGRYQVTLPASAASCLFRLRRIP
jgi:photosystem II stability/assembly factor-like uncharacterized protein